MTIMAGMAVGTAVGQNIAGTMNGAMNTGMNAAHTNNVPPSLPKVTYHVAVDGAAQGPFEETKIFEMINNGDIKRETLLWKQGTPSWEKADSFADFAKLFPPEIPK